MTPRRAKLYTLEVADIIVAKEAYEVYIYNAKQRPFPLNENEWATGADSKVNVEQWPVETIFIDGKPEHLVLDPNLREYLEEPFRQKLDGAKAQIRWVTDERDSYYRMLCRAEKEIKRLSEPWYVKLQRRLRKHAS